MFTNNCQDNNNVSMSSISWEALLLLPAFRYMKPPVDTVPQLYERYISGNEKGSFAFVYEENTFYTFHPRGLNPGEWKPIDGGLSSFFEIDQTLLLEGDILVYNASKQKFVVKSGNVWNKIKSAFTQINRFLNQVEYIPTETDNAGVYFISNNTLSALYIVLSEKVIKIYNSEDHYFRNAIDILLNVLRDDITSLKATKVDRSELPNVSVGIKDYKPSVTNISDLPASNNTTGDARVVKSDLNESGQSYIWLWNGTSWSRTAFTTFPSDAATVTQVELKADIGNYYDPINLGFISKSLNGRFIFSATLKTTYFLPVKKGNVITIGSAYEGNDGAAVSFWDRNKVYIGSLPLPVGVVHRNIVLNDDNIPNDAYFIRTTSIIEHSYPITGITLAGVIRYANDITSELDTRLEGKADIIDQNGNPVVYAPAGALPYNLSGIYNN